MALLEIKNVDISYGKNVTVRDCSIALNEGQICSIVGESGSGKTTVIRAALGLLPGAGKVTAGDIVYDGRSLLQLNKRQWRALRGRDISMIFQDSGAMMNQTRQIGASFVEYIRTHERVSRADAWKKGAEMLGFREYLKGYIESNFEMVKFVYSGSISSEEEELQFIQAACEQGVEGFMSFVTYDLANEVALCEQNHAYYLLASGTVAAEDFEAVEENPWFLGMFGPGQPFEFQAGADMARFFIKEKVGRRYFVLSGGASMGNEMHYQRTLGILDTLSSAYGASFSQPREQLARTPEPVTAETERVSVTICPGYISFDSFLESAREVFLAGEYDAVLSVLPPAEMVAAIGKTPLGVVDSYNTRNLQLVTDGVLRFVVGKYSSIVGPAFALMLNAVTGYAEDFREGGRAVKVIQGFWVSDSAEDYSEKYALSTSAAMNAYNFDDLSAVTRIYNPDANLNALCALAEACSYRAVQARRSNP